MAARKSSGSNGGSKGKAKAAPASPPAPRTYEHPDSDTPLRPEIGTQAQFRKKKAARTYRYDSSLSPALDWDGQNPAREQGEQLIRQILEAKSLAEARAAAARLQALGAPFLNWAGKAERLSFDVPTLPLFVHERLSTKAILETLKGHTRNQQQELELFADPKHSIADQVLRAYEHRDRWTNRMILGDSLVVMNSLLEYEGLGGQVQMIYIDPPYGVKFGSNFQPFVRKRDVKHNDDGDMTREPEMVQAYRDTWELGLHSYLTYLRDRLLVARELLTPSGSVFVQISDENLHHVREIMDEVFGPANFASLIVFAKTTGATVSTLPSTCDYLLWYARDSARMKYFPPYVQKNAGSEAAQYYDRVQLASGDRRAMTQQERANPSLIPEGASIFRFDNLTSQSIGRDKGEGAASWFPVLIDGKEYRPNIKVRWKTNEEGMRRLLSARRVEPRENSLSYIRFLSDFPAVSVGNVWDDLRWGFDAVEKSYVVQTNPRVVARCVMMTTSPGDLVLDPTCGSGTTAHVAEQWGRRWITIDTSRVPLALARQRLLTSTFPWYELKDDRRGPSGGFVYKRRQNNKGEEVGGIVPHITLKSIANDEPPAEEVLVDRPEETKGITRVTGPFVFEATIPTPVDWEGDGVEDSGVAAISESHASFVDRMLEVLRRSPVIRLDGNRTVTLRNVRAPARAMTLSAEAAVDASSHTGSTLPTGAPTISDGAAEAPRPVALVFGPESGAVSDKLVFEAAREAHAKNYRHLYVVGFSIQPSARELVEKGEQAFGIPATYVQVTPDVMMGDLLKNMRSSQIFSACGLPEVEVAREKANVKGDPERWRVTLKGIDVFDPVTMELDHRKGDDVPAWFLDTDYNDLCFHVDQAFFPRTAAWDNLKRSLKTAYEEGVWDHLAGSTSASFTAGEHRKIAVKVIDDRGNELMVVRTLE